MRWGMGMFAIGVALVVLAGVATASGSPIVSPGLDQDVVLGDTVYLDGGGTHVPNGELDRLEWSIETPDGGTITPECTDCEQTSFQPNGTGKYNATLSVWSESGIQRSDTLYVTVRTQDTTGDPAMEESSNGGGSNGDGCYIGYASDTGDNVCSHVGDVVETELDDSGNNIGSLIVTDEGFTNEYTGVERAPNGRFRIDYDTMESETEDRYEAEIDDDNTDPHITRMNNRDSVVGWNEFGGGSETDDSDSGSTEISTYDSDSDPISSPWRTW